MQYVREYAQRAASLFKENRTTTVHSSYQSTINIECDGQLFSLQPAGLPRTPICINLDVRPDIFSSYKPAKGTVVQFTPEGVYGFNTVFLHEGAQSWSPSIAERFAENTAYGKRLKELLVSFIRSQKHRGGLEDIAVQVAERSYRHTGMTAEYARGILEKMLIAGREKKLQEVAQGAAELIGAGIGLTPSGDDFNIGLLAVFYFVGGNAEATVLKNLLVPLIRENVKGTTAVSQAFLLCAGEGEFSEGIIDTLEAAQNEGDLIDPLNRICGTGHSSGLDCLNGMLMGFTLMEALHENNG